MKLPKLAERFLERLQWPVWVVRVEGRKEDSWIETEVIDVQKWKGRHIIFVPKSYLKNPDYYLLNWITLFCEVLLAERIDPIFGSYSVVGKIESEEYLFRVEILACAKYHEELLISDVRNEILGRDLTIEGCQSVQQALIRAVEITKENPQVKKYLTPYLATLKVPLMIAITIAEDERHHLGLGAEKMLELFDDDTCQYVKKILGIYREFPLLTWDKERMLAEFEMSVQRISLEVLKANFLPKMVDHPDFPGRKVWSVE